MRLPELPALDGARNGEMAFRHPPMLRCGMGTDPDSAKLEQTLTEWFGAPALLFSSGRAAAHVFLQERGFDRNRHTIAVPRYLTRCILNALTLDAFPVRDTAADAILYYHPYGIRLTTPPREHVVIEDATHAFFGSESAGVRNWRGNCAIFSLSKFFSTSGIAGVLVVPDAAEAERIRRRRDAFPAIAAPLAAWRRDVIVESNLQGAAWAGNRLLDAAYALLTEYPAVDPATLHGVPTDVAGMRSAGAARKTVLDRYAEKLGPLFPWQLLTNGTSDLPFALPYVAGNPRSLAEIDRLLKDIGVNGRGVYQLNLSGSPYDHQETPGLLLPVHQYLPLETVDAVCAIIRNVHQSS